MKGSRSSNNMQNKQLTGHRPTPEIRDNLDSRNNEEQLPKGNSATHNKKETKKEDLRNKSED